MPGQKNTLTGFVEPHAMNEFQFAAQFAAHAHGARLGTEGNQANKANKAKSKRPRGELEGEWWGSWAPPSDDEEASDEHAAVCLALFLTVCSLSWCPISLSFDMYVSEHN